MAAEFLRYFIHYLLGSLIFVALSPLDSFAQHTEKNPPFPSRDTNQIPTRKITELKEVRIQEFKGMSAMGYLPDQVDGIIYAGKKTELIRVDSLDANTAQNNPRQILGRIPGANYSETEGSGFPSNGIGFRGLDPSQSIEINTRQNGYAIAADLYGYPEAYYLPPMEATEKIELIRGGASLAFGPQFGGVINYITPAGDLHHRAVVRFNQSFGSYGFRSLYLSAGGQIGKFNYYSFLQSKSQDGWRPNSDFHSLSAMVRFSYQIHSKIRLGFEYSILRNRIHMPGGLSDFQFGVDPRASYRARNWLESPWNIMTGTVDYSINKNTFLGIKATYLFSARNLVWKNEEGGPSIADSISTITLLPVNREVQQENFKNWTLETRLLTRYRLGANFHSLSIGLRAYNGRMDRKGGGLGSTGADFNLQVLNPRFSYSLKFTTTNLAPYIENKFQLGTKLTITPGFRFEYLATHVSGYTTDSSTEVNSQRVQKRYFPLLGLAIQVLTGKRTNAYFNISQAYRPIDFSFQTPFASTAKIDPLLKDPRGFTIDFGWRANIDRLFNMDLSVFYIDYKNRIGRIEKVDSKGQPYLYTTNVANSIHKGMELYVELNLTRVLLPASRLSKLVVFNSFAYTDARYQSGPFAKNYVEYSPKTINRLGVRYSHLPFSLTALSSYTAKSYGDANNSETSPDPAGGLIPAYQVFDIAGSVHLKRYTFNFGVNNLAGRLYFTRRTSEYPGPGIIPAAPRTFYLSAGCKF